jgi:hypothetical protein
MWTNIVEKPEAQRGAEFDEMSTGLWKRKAVNRSKLKYLNRYD